MNFDSAKFAAVVESAKDRAAADASWVRAIDRAAAGITSGEIIVTSLAHGAIVTTEGGTYHANGACGCVAFKRRHAACKHRAAARLVDIYESAMKPVETVTAESLRAVTYAAA